MQRNWSDHAALPLRLALGFGLAWHGYPKLFTEEGHQSLVGMLQGYGIPAAEPLAWGVGAFEFFGGLLLIAGAFTAAVATIGIVEMLVAALVVHLPAGFSFMNITGMTPEGPTFGMPGYEVNVLYIAGFMALVLGGAGILSVDAWRNASRRERTATVPPHRIPEREHAGAAPYP